MFIKIINKFQFQLLTYVGDACRIQILHPERFFQENRMTRRIIWFLSFLILVLQLQHTRTASLVVKSLTGTEKKIRKISRLFHTSSFVSKPKFKNRKTTFYARVFNVNVEPHCGGKKKSPRGKGLEFSFFIHSVTATTSISAKRYIACTHFLY